MFAHAIQIYSWFFLIDSFNKIKNKVESREDMRNEKVGVPPHRKSAPHRVSILSFYSAVIPMVLGQGGQVPLRSLVTWCLSLQ